MCDGANHVSIVPKVGVRVQTVPRICSVVIRMLIQLTSIDIQLVVVASLSSGATRLIVSIK